MNSEADMAKTLEQEKAAIEEDARKLDERRRKLEEREREQAIMTIEKSGLLKVEPQRLTILSERIKALGIDEVTKRLAA